MNKVEKPFSNLQVKTEYKKLLQNSAYNISLELDERITITQVIYALVDGYLDDALKDIKHKTLHCVKK